MWVCELDKQLDMRCKERRKDNEEKKPANFKCLRFDNNFSMLKSISAREKRIYFACMPACFLH